MLRFLLEKEFKQLLRNKFLPRMILVMPFTVLLIFPLAANFSISNINLCVVDNDHSPLSRELIEKIGASNYFRIVNTSALFKDALVEVETGRADIILEIPRGFEKDLAGMRSPGLLVSANSVNGTKGGLGSSYLAMIIQNFSTELRGRNMPELTDTIQPVAGIVSRFLFNPRLEYPVFMVPALMVMLMTMLCGFLPALNIVGEKEKGTLEQINVTPIKRFTFILSKLIPYWSVGFIVLTMAFGIARLFYALVPVGSIAVMYLFASLFTMTISGFGLVISNYARTVQQAMFMMFFFAISFILMSGLYTPVESMPLWAQRISSISPLKYFILVTRQVYLKGSGFGDLIPSFTALAALALLFNGWAVLSYRKKR
jgi:ABC-2 type transport system permease protein